MAGPSNLFFSSTKDSCCEWMPRASKDRERWHNLQAMMHGPFSEPHIIAPRNPVVPSGKKKGLIKLRSTELYPEHAHAPPASCSQTPLAHEQRVFNIRPCWLRMSSHGPFPAWFLGLRGKPGVNIGLLLVQMVRLHFLALETINNPLKTKKHLSVLGNFGRSGFHKPNAFQMFFFLMPNVSYMRHPVFIPGQM